MARGSAAPHQKGDMRGRLRRPRTPTSLTRRATLQDPLAQRRERERHRQIGGDIVRIEDRVDLDQVEALRAGALQCCFDRQDSKLLTLCTYDAYFTCADAAVGSLIACDG